jgi:hypothetical protein
MRRLIVAEFLTLDGVMEAPAFEEHRDGKNAWALRFQTPEMQEFKDVTILILTGQDLSAADRERLNGKVAEVVRKGVDPRPAFAQWLRRASAAARRRSPRGADALGPGTPLRVWGRSPRCRGSRSAACR